MPRGRKCRRVCAEPRVRGFWPEQTDSPPVTLSVEELEALRLCDLETMDQNQAAACMEVSRGTLQRILYAAHRKVAQALVTGQGIVIRGGQYAVRQDGCRCTGGCSHCSHRAGRRKDDISPPHDQPHTDTRPIQQNFIQKEDDVT